MTEKINLTCRTSAEDHTRLQMLIGIPYAVLKISDEEFRIAIANAKFLTDPKNFIAGYKSC